MRRVTALWIAWTFCLLAAPPPARANREDANLCLECHRIASAFHVKEWKRSAHFRADISCTDCHGGDERQNDPQQAHTFDQEKRSSANREKAVLALCGECHEEIRDAFAVEPRHLELRNRDQHSPTCVACHSNAGGRFRAPQDIGKVCRSCHSEKSAPQSAHVVGLVERAVKSCEEARLEQKKATERVSRLSGLGSQGGRRTLRSMESRWEEVGSRFHRLELERAEALCGELAPRYRKIFPAR